MIQLFDQNGVNPRQIASELKIMLFHSGVSELECFFAFLGNELLISVTHVIAESSGTFFKITEFCNSECCLHSGLPGGTVWFVLPSLHKGNSDTVSSFRDK